MVSVACCLLCCAGTITHKLIDQLNENVAALPLIC